MQANLEGPKCSLGKVEAPKYASRIYAYTKGDVEAKNPSTA